MGNLKVIKIQAWTVSEQRALAFTCGVVVTVLTKMISVDRAPAHRLYAI
jgi:hypothetical protein